MVDLLYSYLESPIGDLLLAGDGEALHYVGFPSGCRAMKPKAEWTRDDTAFDEVKYQLRAYFAGELKEFDLPLHFTGTDFQKKVWQTLLEVGYGKTTSYGDIANRIGKPTASRAVGAANGANPIPIIVPCHRIIGANKSLTGFGGGLDLKEFLLKLEGSLPEEQPSLF